jgi:release factor H-coupled RctB family protein
LTDVPIHRFFSERAWVEGSALNQLDILSKAHPDVLALAAMPDLHPGKFGPVGIGMLSTDIHPPIVGSDIGCGMGLFETELEVRKFKAEKVADRLTILDQPWDGDLDALRDDWSLTPTPYDVGLGTIGGGNHFCEFQAIHEIVNPDICRAQPLSTDRVYILVHSGSRALGFSILDKVLAAGSHRLEVESEAGQAYLNDHDAALRWAGVNRCVIADRAAEAARTRAHHVTNVPHNFLERTDRGVLHRKGAAPTNEYRSDGPPALWDLVPIPGSRDSLSYLVRPLPGADPNALACLAHGAGRKYDRKSMHGRIEKVKSVREGMKRNSFGGVVVCEDRNLIVEEAPGAYKNIDRVIDDLVKFGLAEVVATFKPLVTYKTSQSHQSRDA